MKTWTNPIVEELAVKLTADGDEPFYVEKLPGWPDLDYWKKEETPS